MASPFHLAPLARPCSRSQGAAKELPSAQGYSFITLSLLGPLEDSSSGVAKDTITLRSACMEATSEN